MDFGLSMEEYEPDEYVPSAPRVTAATPVSSYLSNLPGPRSPAGGSSLTWHITFFPPANNVESVFHVFKNIKNVTCLAFLTHSDDSEICTCIRKE